MPRLPFDVGLAQYDPPPPDRLDDLSRLRHENAVRAANELRAWIEVDDGRIVAHGFDGEGKLQQKSGTLDFEGWHRETFGERTPWGESDAPALATAAESELERALSAQVMRGRAETSRRTLEPGETLVEQGEQGREL